MDTSATSLARKGASKLLKTLPGGGRIREWYRQVTTDAYLVSFPKCGRTWLRLMTGRALQQHFGLVAEREQILDLTPLADLQRGVPRVRVNHAGGPEHKRADELNLEGDDYRKAKIILLIRDLRDIVVSYYFHRRNRKMTYQDTLKQFVYEPAGSFDVILQYYKRWYELRHAPQDVMLVRYEDIHKNAERELCRVLEFIGVEGVEEAIVKEAVKYAAFDNMRKMEQDSSLDSKRLRPGGARGERNYEDEQAYKTRKGKAGGFLDHLASEEIAYMSERIRKELPSYYGYHPEQ